MRTLGGLREVSGGLNPLETPKEHPKRHLKPPGAKLIFIFLHCTLNYECTNSLTLCHVLIYGHI